MPVRMVTCIQCDKVFAGNELSKHKRNVHGPSNWRRKIPLEHPPSPPDVQEDRRSFRANIQNIVREFDALPSQAIEECSHDVGDMPVFGALYAYTYTHLKLCAPTKQSLLDDLGNLKTEWISEGDAGLFHLKTMKDELVRILRESQVNEHICNTRLINKHTLHDLDINNIAALIVERTVSEEHAHGFYTGDEKVQYMIDALQNLLTLQSEEIEKYRAYLLNAIIKLSRKSGRFPGSLQLHQIQEMTRTEFSGGFGVIFRGKLGGRVVAIKKVEMEDRPKEFANEAVVWCYARHPNCLPFYGVVDEGTRKFLVAPWMTNGHVKDYLKANPHTDRLPLILDVACGLEYLHSMQPKIIHGDLKCANILITSSGRACLADFGIATVRDINKQMTTATFRVGGTIHYMAPELLAAESNDDLMNLDRCDMYAFGCVCYEMFVGMAPFEGLDEVQIRVAVLGRRRPKKPTQPIQGLDDAMWRFIQSLWNHAAMRRPTAAKACVWISERMVSEGKSTERPSAEVEWDVEFLADAAVTMAGDDTFALAL